MKITYTYCPECVLAMNEEAVKVCSKTRRHQYFVLTQQWTDVKIEFKRYIIGTIIRVKKFFK